MNLEKLFGSKTKVDILKYLLFRRQGISMRALESELEWTFPAIKKQVDSLEEACVIDVNKEGQGRSISLKPDFFDKIRDIFFFGLKQELIELFKTYDVMIEKYYFGKRFGLDLDMDLVVIYKNVEKPQIDKIKDEINTIFRQYFIEIVYVVFMSSEEREKRYRLADRFVLQIMRSIQKT
ncbi:MAG: hypothetical protein PHR61_03985 [Candidatus Absconditabacteria bacterium]|nr:hypothetical protein [Candidatus Absconditabacteria bacterium]